MTVHIDSNNSIVLNQTQNYHDPELDAIVRSILVSRAQEGATIQDIRDDYRDEIGENFPYFENTTDYLLQLKNVVCKTDSNGTRIFNLISSEKSQHIISMVRNQKPPKQHQQQNNFNTQQQSNYFNKNKKQHNNNYHNITNNNNHQYPQHYLSSWTNNCRSTPIEEDKEIDYNQHFYGPGYQNNCFFEDNYQYLKKFGMGSCDTLYTKPTNTSGCNSHGGSEWKNHQYGGSGNSGSNQNLNINNEFAHIYDYQLMGDDFFLAMAKMELESKYTKVNGILHAGLCISGQTIHEANYRIQTTEKLNRRLILNVGSVDILQGHHLIDMQYDFIQLLYSFEARGIQPILTTLAPLANHGHRPEIKRMLERFNEFIRSIGLPYIDIWKALSNRSGQTLYDCYQNGARHVTGSNHPHVFWNKIGRQRILNTIKANLEYLPM